jgi:hypothetical protein
MRRLLALFVIAMIGVMAFSGCVGQNGLSDAENKENTQKNVNYIYAVETMRTKPRVMFIENSSNSSNGIVSWNWNFGDGNVSPARNAVHTYEQFGEYKVNLTVNYDSGKSEAFSYSVNVSKPEEEDVNSTTFMDFLSPTNDGLPNKWAIMETDDYENIDQFESEPLYKTWMSNTLWANYDIIKKLGFPEEHIIVLLNEQFTKNNLNRALDYIDKASQDPKNATVMLFHFSHGACEGTIEPIGTTVYQAPLHSFSLIRKCNTTNKEPEFDYFYDYEMKSILDNHSYGKFLTFIESCMSGCYAGDDTTGKAGSLANAIYSDSCGAPGRIIITSATAPLSTAGSFDGKDVAYTRFWKEGLLEGKADSLPTGNMDGKASVEEAWLYYKITSPRLSGNEALLNKLEPVSSQPCMNDQYEGEMIF